MDYDFNKIYRSIYINARMIIKNEKVYIKTRKEEILLSKENIDKVISERVKEASNLERDAMRGSHGYPSYLTDELMGRYAYVIVNMFYQNKKIGIVNLDDDNYEKFKKILLKEGVKFSE